MIYYKVWLHTCSNECDADTDSGTHDTLREAVEDLNETLNECVCNVCGTIRVELSEHWTDNSGRKEKTLLFYNNKQRTT